jgi:hypothetical protein
VDALIEAKRFDEAMAALALYTRGHPRDLNRAGERLRRIAEIQGRYNTLVNQLLDIVVPAPNGGEVPNEGQPPAGEERILALIGELESLESPKDHRTGEFLSRIRELVKFAVYRKRLEEIFAGGRELSRAGDYPGALRLYLGELEFYREEFFPQGRGEEAENPVREYILRLSALPGTLESSLAVLDGVSKDLGEFPPEALPGVYGRIKPELDTLDRVAGEIGGAGAFFDSRLLGAEPAGEDGNFFSFASRLVYGQGRGGDSGRDGMLRIAEECLAKRTLSLEALLVSGAEEAYDRALAKARERRYREAIEDYEEAAVRNALARDFLEGKSGSGEILPAGAGPVPAASPGLPALFFQDFAISRSIRTETLELRLDQIAAESGEQPEAGEAGEKFKAGLRDLAAAAEALEEELRGAGEAVPGFEEGTPPPGEGPLSPGSGAMSRYTAGALELLENFRSRRLALELDGSFRRYAVFSGSLGERLERRKARLTLANRLMGGLKREEAALLLREAGVEVPLSPESPPGDETLYYYAKEALGIFEILKAETEEDLGSAGEFFARYGEDGRGIRGSPELEALRVSTGEMAEELGEIRNQGIAGAALAEGRISQAEGFRTQGDRYYQEAREAVQRGDFAGARNSIQRAAAQYSQSLSIQEVPSLREEWDTRMLTLGQEIGQGENEALVKDTRNAINEVRTEYLAGNFQQAENLLLRGQNRWMQTNADENPEIGYWLSMVRTAISLRSGKEIPVTAPLFAEMGQLLSGARRIYEEGAALIRAGRRDEGLTRFNAARENIRRIKFVFPQNQEAGMLELRMDQMADPEVFNASFRRRFDEALAGIKRRSPEAFWDLQNLAEINPSYPEIAAALRQAEIDMGYRPAPPDPQKLRRSADLTGAARSIVDANDRQQLEAALRQLNEALILDPGNTQAMSLKDIVQTRMGAGNAVLSSADEGEYQRAVRELQRGNLLISMAIVDQLLLNPRNRSSTRVLELQRRIQLLL